MINRRYFIPILFLGTALLASCSKDDKTEEEILPDTPTLTKAEANGLIFMREEEKLARDVYTFSYNKYGETIFSKISTSEQKHMDRVLAVLNYYNIPDPASAESGIFNNHELQTLYDDLVAKSDIDLMNALIVGATIEDLDIRDLDSLTGQTANVYILDAYDFLNCGSRNHIRGFVGQIESNGGSYTPQFISNDRYTEILAGSHENCNN